MTGWKWKEINVFTGEEQAFFKVCQVILPIKAIKDKAFVIWRDHKGFHVPESIYVSVCKSVRGKNVIPFMNPKTGEILQSCCVILKIKIHITFPPPHSDFSSRLGGHACF